MPYWSTIVMTTDDWLEKWRATTSRSIEPWFEPFVKPSVKISRAWAFRATRPGASICVKHWGAQSFPSPPVSPSPPSSFPFLPFPPSLCPPFSCLPSPSSPLPLLWGSGGYAPGTIFFRYTCSHASFSAFLTQKSAVYLTRFLDNNFAFLQ
jgi:hypothetical protein